MTDDLYDDWPCATCGVMVAFPHTVCTNPECKKEYEAMLQEMVHLANKFDWWDR